MSPKAEILKALGLAERVLVAMHAAPDGDSAGSGLALGLALMAQGRQVVWVAHDPIPDRLAFLPFCEHVKRWNDISEQSFDGVIAVDCGSAGRLGAPEEFWRRDLPLINIDHHAHNPEFGTLNWVDSTKSSTGEMITELFWEGQWSLSLDEAICLYTAISTDTLSFRQMNSRANTLKAAHWLATSGLDLGELNRMIWECRPVGEIRLLGWALEAVELSQDGRIAWVSVPRRVMEQFGVDDSGVDTIVHHLLSIDTVELAVLGRESQAGDPVKVSWRGKPPWDVAVLAEEFGGGGHSYAAAALVPGLMDEVIARVVASLRERLDD